MLRNLLIVFFAGFILVFCGCKTTKKQNENENTRNTEFLIGKSFVVSVGKSETIDAVYLEKVYYLEKKVYNKKIKYDKPYFDMMNDVALLNLIAYLKKYDLEVAPGDYKLNQGWGFEDGYFIIGNRKQKVLKFRKK